MLPDEWACLFLVTGLVARDISNTKNCYGRLGRRECLLQSKGLDTLGKTDSDVLSGPKGVDWRVM